MNIRASYEFLELIINQEENKDLYIIIEGDIPIKERKELKNIVFLKEVLLEINGSDFYDLVYIRDDFELFKYCNKKDIDNKPCLFHYKNRILEDFFYLEDLFS